MRECRLLGEPSILSVHSCIGNVTSGMNRLRSRHVVESHFEIIPASPKSCTRNGEEATRQQGGLFFRENSSNGGKAIRTFWRNTKFGKMRCQGQNLNFVSL